MGKALEKVLVEVTWVDAVSGDVNAEDLPSKSNLDLMRVRTSYGRLLQEDEHGISLVNTEDQQKTEYTAIPREWIKNVKYYRGQAEV